MTMISPLTLEHLDPWSELLAVSFGRHTADMAQFLHHFLAQRTLLAYGAWDGTRLVAQYCCLLVRLHLPESAVPLPAGMSINMAVHPNYRGQGLVKQVARPVYEAVMAREGVAGVGFSNAAGVKVDRHSKGYGYRVVGKMVPVLAWLFRPSPGPPLALSAQWPCCSFDSKPDNDHICFAATPRSLRHRFADYPLRPYHFGVCASGQTRGIVVYRPVTWGRVRGAALLAAYSDNLPSLIGRWTRALCDQGVRLVHVLVSPASSLLRALRQVALCIPLPYSRSPYYLTAKPLTAAPPASLFDFSRWDCSGGDIL